MKIAYEALLISLGRLSVHSGPDDDYRPTEDDEFAFVQCVGHLVTGFAEYEYDLRELITACIHEDPYDDEAFVTRRILDVMDVIRLLTNLEAAAGVLTGPNARLVRDVVKRARSSSRYRNIAAHGALGCVAGAPAIISKKRTLAGGKHTLLLRDVPDRMSELASAQAAIWPLFEALRERDQAEDEEGTAPVPYDRPEIDLPGLTTSSPIVRLVAVQGELVE